jgi:hypothetical protein
MYTLIRLAILTALIGSCIALPAITPKGKVSPTETEWVAPWNVADHADDMMESKGWEKPKNNTEDESALWLGIAGTCAGLSILSFIIAYVTAPCHKAIGVGVILGISALVCTGISAIIGWIGLVVGVGLIAVLVYLGVKLRDYDVIKHIKSTLGS